MQVSYDSIVKNEFENNVGFFKISDGEEAIVRFMVDSIDDMEIITLHGRTPDNKSLMVNGKFRQISCTRNANDPIENCPLCEAGYKIQSSVFIRLIHYVRNNEGMIEPKCEIWQRNASTYVPLLMGYLNNYGPLSQILCKVVRHGQKLDTTYDIMPNLNPQQYPIESFPIVKEPFEGYHALGTIILDKSPEDISAFLHTGQFPENEDTDNYNQTTYADNNNMVNNGYANSQQVNMDNRSMNNNRTTIDTESMQRPIRRY